MKRHIYSFMMSVLLLVPLFAAAEDAKDPNQLFYRANAYYEKGDYAKAIEDYIAILDSGIESGNLYYNVGNAFLKLGKVGYAILCYEKAKRLIPADGDLKANLDYARSFVEDAASRNSPHNILVRLARRPFRDFNLNALAILALILYIAVAAFSILNFISTTLYKRTRLLYFVVMVLFLLNLVAFATRYYGEEVLRKGIVLQKDLECKYEPIDKSTTYYKVHEGEGVIIINTRNGWRKIKRSDGKIAWVKKEVVEEI